jgi:hypothetical protein
MAEYRRRWRQKGGKVRSKKSNAKVDLTAMVDLAFYYYIFYAYHDIV